MKMDNDILTIKIFNLDAFNKLIQTLRSVSSNYSFKFYHNKLIIKLKKMNQLMIKLCIEEQDHLIFLKYCQEPLHYNINIGYLNTALKHFNDTKPIILRISYQYSNTLRIDQDNISYSFPIVRWKSLLELCYDKLSKNYKKEELDKIITNYLFRSRFCLKNKMYLIFK